MKVWYEYDAQVGKNLGTEVESFLDTFAKNIVRAVERDIKSLGREDLFDVMTVLKELGEKMV